MPDANPAEQLQAVKHLLTSVSAIHEQTKRTYAASEPTLAPRFNPLETVRPNENIISRILAYFLNAESGHGQGRKFLEIFLLKVEEVLAERRLTQHGDAYTSAISALSSYNEKIEFEIQLEFLTDKQDRIDILIELSNASEPLLVIAVENKPWAKDQKNQLVTYDTFLKSKYLGKYLQLYLTPYGRKPDRKMQCLNECDNLCNDGKLAYVGYNNLLIPIVQAWAQACQSDRVRNFLQDLQNHLNITVLNMPPEKDEMVIKFLTQPAQLETTLLILNSKHDVFSKLQKKFQDDIIKEIAIKLPHLKSMHCAVSDWDKKWTHIVKFKQVQGTEILLQLEFHSSHQRDLVYGIALPLDEEEFEKNPSKAQKVQNLKNKIFETLQMEEGQSDSYWAGFTYIEKFKDRSWTDEEYKSIAKSDELAIEIAAKMIQAYNKIKHLLGPNPAVGETTQPE